MKNNRVTVPVYKIAGITLVELLVVVAVLATLTGLGIAGYSSYRDTAFINTSKQELIEISALIERYKLATDNWPDSLSDIKQQNKKDPWGNNYIYAKIPRLIGVITGQDNSNIRKDANLRPINTFYDLYSKGMDGKTQPNISTDDSKDDVIRARDGDFIGLASDY